MSSSVKARGTVLDQAQRAGHRAVGRTHRLAGVEPDVGLTGDEDCHGTAHQQLRREQ